MKKTNLVISLSRSLKMLVDAVCAKAQYLLYAHRIFVVELKKVIHRSIVSLQGMLKATKFTEMRMTLRSEDCLDIMMNINGKTSLLKEIAHGKMQLQRQGLTISYSSYVG